MADTKISALTDLGAEPASDDKLVVVDTSATLTKRVDWSVLKALFTTHALATAANDFIVASGAGVFVKKTLAETLTILGKAAASGLASLDGSSKVVQDPANATATPTASKIPIADGSGKLDGWVTDAAADGSTKGKAAFTAADFSAASGVISLDYANGQKASESQPGFLTEVASTAEVNTGTDSVRAVSPDSLAGSYAGSKNVFIMVADPSTTPSAIGDAKAHFMVPPELNGMNLVDADGVVTTVSSSGTPTFALRRERSGSAVDMLSTNITIDVNEKTSYTAVTAPVINATNDDVATGDIIFVDLDVIGTGAKGHGVVLTFRLP